MRSSLARAEAWLTRERVRTYALILLAGYGAGLVALVASLHQGVDRFGKPLGADFIIFYAASALTLKGKALLVFAPQAMLAAEQTVAAGSRALFLWCYPPTFHLMVTPLALLPYRWALAAWLGTTGGLYLAMTRLISRERDALLLALAFPAAFLNFAQGQNGFLTAGLMGAGLLLLDRRPWIAGLLLGGLIYKPHFGLLLPVLLVASGRWRSVIGAALSAGGLVVAATAMFGIASWRAFLATLPVVSHNLAAGLLPLAKSPSLFASLRLLGCPVVPALAANLLMAAPMAVLTVLAWRRPGPLALKAGLAVLATLALSPYLFDYDLVLLAIPVGVLATQAASQGAPTGSRLAAAMAFAAPLALEPAAQGLHLQLMPVVTLLLYVAIWRALGHARTRTAPEQGFRPRAGNVRRTLPVAMTSFWRPTWRT